MPFLIGYTVNYTTVNLTVNEAIIPVLSINNWIIIQQRIDNSTNFTRPWYDYKNGFGTFDKNYWMGLENMHQLTSGGNYRLRMELQTMNASTWFSVEYDSFVIDDESL